MISVARPIVCKPSAAIVETAGAVYELLQVVSYDLAGDVLIIDVDCLEPHDRQYRLEWRHARGELAVVGHCAPGSMDALETSELPVNEAFDLLRFVETSPEIESKRAHWKLDALTEG